jgi:hypothetical protein
VCGSTKDKLSALTCATLQAGRSCGKAKYTVRLILNWPGCHAGLAVRMSTTFVVMQCGYTMLEAVWFAIAWIPKVPTS